MGYYMDSKCGYYYVKISIDGTTYKFSTRTKNESLARDIYETFLKNLFDQRSKRSLSQPENYSNISNSSQSITLEAAWDEYFETVKLKGFAKTTIKVKEFTRKLCSDHIKSLADFNQANINRIFAAIPDYSQDSRRKYLAEIKAFLNYCIRRTYYDSIRYNAIEWPTFKTKQRETVITKEHLQQIFEAADQADPDFGSYLKTLYYTFSRPGEVVSLKASDINLNNNTVRIYMNKTDKDKVIPIVKQIRPLLEKLCQSEPEYLFKGINQGPEYYSKKFKKLKTRMGLPAEYNLYTIRHTASTNIWKVKKDTKLAAYLLGNTEDIVYKYYVNLQEEDHAESMNDIEI